MAISRDIFREYDIRGVAGKDLTEEVATAVAGAFAAFMLERRRPPLVRSVSCHTAMPSIIQRGSTWFGM